MIAPLDNDDDEPEPRIIDTYELRLDSADVACELLKCDGLNWEVQDRAEKIVMRYFDYVDELLKKVEG